MYYALSFVGGIVFTVVVSLLLGWRIARQWDREIEDKRSKEERQKWQKKLTDRALFSLK